MKSAMYIFMIFLKEGRAHYFALVGRYVIVSQLVQPIMENA